MSRIRPASPWSSRPIFCAESLSASCEEISHEGHEGSQRDDPTCNLFKFSVVLRCARCVRISLSGSPRLSSPLNAVREAKNLTRRSRRFTTITITTSAFCLLPSAFCLLPSAFCLLPSAFCLLPSAFRLPPSAFRLPPSAFRLPPSAFRPPSSISRRDPWCPLCEDPSAYFSSQERPSVKICTSLPPSSGFTKIVSVALPSLPLEDRGRGGDQVAAVGGPALGL